MKPIDRFGIDLSRIKFLPPDQVSDELFYAEQERSVSKDNTLLFQNTRYEVSVDLRDKKVTVRFDRHKPDRIIVYYKGNRMGEAKPLDRVANALKRNPKLNSNDKGGVQ
jgi:hypothetical protein